MTVNELTKKLVRYAGNLKVEIDCMTEGLWDIETVELEEGPDGEKDTVTITSASS